MSDPRHFLSLGAGVQSSTLALMAAAGEIGPMPDAAIFADTQWEPAEVIVAKHRNGATGVARFHFDYSTMTFTDAPLLGIINAETGR